MKKSITKEINKLSLLKILTNLNEVKIPFLPFFGTLLGIVREGDIIEGDDDIDFLSDKKYYETIKFILVLRGYKVTSYDLKDVFTQFTTTINGVDVLIDFYYFEDLEGDYILEKWNFYGQPHNRNTHLLIPKKYIFPLQNVKFNNMSITLPSSPIEVCNYLYGRRFREKMRKGIDYSHKIVNNTPQIIYK